MLSKRITTTSKKLFKTLIKTNPILPKHAYNFSSQNPSQPSSSQNPANSNNNIPPSVTNLFSPLQLQLIERTLVHVPKYSWSDTAILAACAQLGLSPAAHRIIRPFDVIRYCMASWNFRALRKVDDTNFANNTRIRDKITYGIRTRLQQQLQYIDTWNQAMAIGAHPSNIVKTKQLLWEYSDEIWRRCGDKSMDYNYYTKRILFNTAYATTELHLLTDQSIGKTETWKFLDRRIQDIMTVGGKVGQIKTVGGAMIDAAWGLIGTLRQPQSKDINNPIKMYKTDSNININNNMNDSTNNWMNNVPPADQNTSSKVNENASPFTSPISSPNPPNERTNKPTQ